MSLLRRIYEEAEGRKQDKDFFQDEEFVNQLSKCGCIDFLKSEVKTFVDSSISNKLSLSKKDSYEFLKGTAYGYVYAKTGDKKLAVDAGSFVVEMSDKYQKHSK